MLSASQLPPPAREFLRTREAQLHGPIVHRFHAWLARRQINLATLEPVHVEEFVERPVKKLVPGSALHYRYMVMDYLEWLSTRGLIRFHPEQCFKAARAKPALPPSALRFLATRGRRAHHDRPVLRLFHSWMDGKGLDLSRLHPSLIQRFLESPRRRPVKPTTRRNYQRRLLSYLDWLFEQRYLAFDPHSLRTHPKRLPDAAEEFLTALLATRKNTTRDRTALRDFHGWLDRGGLQLTALDRGTITGWFVHLQRRGLHPSTRVGALQCIRVYLRWMRDRGLVQFDPDDLIRPHDRPKLPAYLPRPLPPEADRRLQARLTASESPYALGLLLMRRTGLRIGELRDLDFDPLRTDPQGRTYLKVPLGKLNNERLVPLDDDTRRLVRKLRRGRRKRRWLLETPAGHHTRNVAFNQILRHACDGLDIPDAINTHRLRHTYATSLLSAGMSLVSIMRLLGHRDYRMTLRYAAITQETVRTEYDQALAQMAKRYLVEAASQDSAFEPLKALADLVRWTHNALTDEPSHARLLIRRLQRLRSDLRNLLKNPAG